MSTASKKSAKKAVKKATKTKTKSLDVLEGQIARLIEQNTQLENEKKHLENQIKILSPEKLGSTQFGVKGGSVVMTPAQALQDDQTRVTNPPNGFSGRLAGAVHVIDPSKPIR